MNRPQQELAALFTFALFGGVETACLETRRPAWDESIGEFQSGIVFSGEGRARRAFAFSTAQDLRLPEDTRAISFYRRSLSELGLEGRALASELGALRKARPGDLAWHVDPPDQVWRMDAEGRFTRTEVRPPETYWFVPGERPRTRDCDVPEQVTIRTFPFPLTNLQPLGPEVRNGIGWAPTHVRLEDGSIFLHEADDQDVPRLDADGRPVVDDDGRPVIDERSIGYFHRVTTTTAAHIKTLPLDTHKDAVMSDGEGGVFASTCKERPLVRIRPIDLERNVFERESPFDPCPNMHHAANNVIFRLVQGPGADGSIERFGLTRLGEFFRFGEDLKPETVLNTGLGFLIFDFFTWIGPGQVLVTHSGTSFAWFRDGELETIQPDWNHVDELPPEIERAVLLPSGDVYLTGLGDSTTLFALDRAEQKFHLIERDRTVPAIITMLPLSSGKLLTIGAAGALGMYEPATGFCPINLDNAVFEYDGVMYETNEEGGRVVAQGRPITAAEVRSELDIATLFVAVESQPGAILLRGLKQNRPNPLLFWLLFDP